MRSYAKDAFQVPPRYLVEEERVAHPADGLLSLTFILLSIYTHLFLNFTVGKSLQPNER